MTWVRRTSELNLKHGKKEREKRGRGGRAHGQLKRHFPLNGEADRAAAGDPVIRVNAVRGGWSGRVRRWITAWATKPSALNCEVKRRKGFRPRRTGKLVKETTTFLRQTTTVSPETRCLSCEWHLHRCRRVLVRRNRLCKQDVRAEL